MSYIEPEKYPFLEEIGKQYSVMREEYLSVAEKEIVPWVDVHIKENEDDWSAFPLMIHGHKHKKHWKMCPRTTSILKDIPGLITAGFFVLAPRAHLPAHNNHPRAIYRFHLGVIVPEGCSFRVGEEIRDWREGEWLVFDPNQNHEAWNRSDQYRVILLMDIWRDPNNQPFKDRAFHKLDSWKYLASQTKAGAWVMGRLSSSLWFRALVNKLMGGKGEPELQRLEGDELIANRKAAELRKDTTNAD